MALPLSRLKKQLLFIFIIALAFLWQLRSIKPENTYALDSFVKLVQTVSIKEHSFQSEELLYLAKNFDPSSELHPIPGFVISIREKIISPFSVDFAGFQAIILHFVSMDHLPYVCLLFAILSLIIFNFTKELSLPTLVLASLGTPLLYQGLEFSENSLLLFLQSVGLYFYFKNESQLYRILSGFFLACGVFLRLETIVFIGFLHFFQFAVIYRFRVLQYLKSEIMSIIGIMIPIVIFCLQNIYFYDHLLGARFISNQETLAIFNLASRLLQFKNLLFLAYFKIGFFGFTPMFLWVMVYFLIYQNKLTDPKNKVLLYTLLLFLPIIAFIAPNDGVTNWGARYLNLAILPSLFLFDSFYKEILQESSKLKKVIIYSLFGYSILVLIIGLKFQQVATKEIRLFQEDLTNQTADLHVIGAETIGLYSGIHFFEVPMILPKNQDQLETFLIKNKLMFGSQNKILFSRIKSNASVKEGIKIGLFPSEAHYEELISVLRKYYKKETKIEGKKLIIYSFAKPENSKEDH
jgi:hypothetical protein